MVQISSFVSLSFSAVLPQLPQLEYLCGSREIAHKLEDKKTQKGQLLIWMTVLYKAQVLQVSFGAVHGQLDIFILWLKNLS